MEKQNVKLELPQNGTQEEMCRIVSLCMENIKILSGRLETLETLVEKNTVVPHEEDRV